ncbi:hypothetical protein HYFRA_00011119 [Hymenoscyphus fraxineus]|uniref:Myb-like domain-containing protein n=1 Tax=Hymenoscyphus fraxineus TaxID=746836 RepID=A0A9N9L6I5_9HELO|nr:hypothetical protein HYFRA_00011119 [Hymenoscyphus fraxineus]
MPPNAENTYNTQPGRNLHHNHNINNNPETPSSAVSSFNMPAAYNSNLITPSSPYMQRTASPVIHRENSVKLSPSHQSPVFSQFHDDDGYGAPKFNEPMKFKDSNLQIASPDNGFTGSPWICETPYFGSYGVSATNNTPSGNTSISSLPSIQPHQSPDLNSSGGFSTESRESRQPTPQSAYRTHQTPILIAPNPATLRKDSGGVYRQNSISSTYSQSSTPRTPMSFHHRDNFNTLRSNGSRKRKSPDNCIDPDTLSVDLTVEESLLLQLTDRKEHLPWKEVASVFNEKMGKGLKVPALQMRKKRLERALLIAMQNYEKNKWSNIARDMANHGSTENWTKDAVEKKWYEIHPDFEQAGRYPFKHDYEFGARQHHAYPSYPPPTYPMYNYSPVLEHHKSYPSETMSTRATNYYDTQLPPTHPLHAVQQANQRLPPRPETGSSLSTSSPLSTGNLHHPNLINSSPPMHPRDLSHRQSSISSVPSMMSGVSTVTMDELHERAEEENSTQQAIYQEEKQRVFDELRETERKKALQDVGGRRNSKDVTEARKESA